LGADDQNSSPWKRAMPQMMAASSPKGAVAVNFAEVGEDALDVVEGLGTLRMPRQFGFLPGGLRGASSLPSGYGSAPAAGRTGGEFRIVGSGAGLEKATWRSI
jgi:hypothetical protein